MGYKEMGYKLNETSVRIWKSSLGLEINNINVNTSLCDGSCSFMTKKECEERLNSITPSDEYKKIWDRFDFQAIKNVFRCANADKIKDETYIIIKSCEEFEKTIKDLGLYEAYIKEKELLDKKRKLLENENLIKVKFKSYQSWETGLRFLILCERVDKDIFTKLTKSGLYYHKVDEDNEERFVGWCIRDNEMNRLKLAESGVRAIQEI